MDPVSIAVTSAAIGGVAGKFVEKAWNLGEKWITEYFKSQRLDFWGIGSG